MSAAFLERWLGEVIASPGATGVKDVAEARRVLVDDALRAAPMVDRESGPVIDVGSGGGTPGIPLATVLSDRPFTLLEAERRKCDFLERVSAGLPNVTVVWGRAEEQQPDAYGVALAKALARPPVAAELCLPLVRPGGVAIVWVGQNADTRPVAIVARTLASSLEDDRDGLLVLRKLAPTPAGYPRRPGMAKKRPLA